MLKFNELPIRQPDQRTPERPLGAVSDFVINELPDAVQTGDIAQLRRITRDIHKTNTGNDPHLALLDMKFLERAFMVLNEQRPDVLMEATNAHARALSVQPALLYEDVIIRNPLRTDPRFFSQPAQQSSEHLFYAVHREIELHCCSVFLMMRSLFNDSAYRSIAPSRSEVVNPVVEIPQSMMGPDFEHLIKSMMIPVNDATYAQKVAPSIAGGIMRIRKTLHQLQEEMPVEHFSAIRPFYQPDRERNAPGPSGKFSAGMYCLDESIAPAEFNSFNVKKREEIDFYPTTSVINDQVAGQNDMRHLAGISEKKSILDVLEEIERAHPDEKTDLVKAARLAIPSLMKDARALHYNILLQFVPDIKRGTGNEKNVRAYVAEPIKIYDALCKKVQSTSTDSLQ